MNKITQEIRSKISQLDDLANEIKEYFDDNGLQYGDEFGKEDLSLFYEGLENIGDLITEFQESQGWLDEEPNMPGPKGIPWPAAIEIDWSVPLEGSANAIIAGYQGTGLFGFWYNEDEETDWVAGFPDSDWPMDDDMKSSDKAFLAGDSGHCLEFDKSQGKDKFKLIINQFANSGDINFLLENGFTYYKEDTLELPYSEVKVGMKAWSAESPDEYLGLIVWVGTKEELESTKHLKDLSSDWEGSLEGYDLVVIDDENYGYCLYNYNNDPCGCICIK